MTLEELTVGPRPHIGWLVWHAARVQDSNFSALAGRQQAWISDGWHARFGMPPDPMDFGSGHSQSLEQVEALSISNSKILLDYFVAVLERTKAYLSTLSPYDLDKELAEPRYNPYPTLAVRLVSVIADNMRHVGQIEYLRGLNRHKGWFPNPRKQ